ncbi:MAG TPA: disulfide bond formation protein B [Stellaceae bacterium]|jgi:disulfide bond formation protein DsbB|nr:disulfide bond formation protein B [Stellaceae bacterium]
MGADRVRFPILVLAASLAVLASVLVSQYWGGLTPCELCVMQRWPWVAAAVISLIGIKVSSRSGLSWVALTLAAVFAVSSALAFYHVGVERHWFAGPSACTGAATAADTVEALKERILGQMPVRCDEPAWSLWGISLAGWNLLASLVMGGSCLAAFSRLRRPYLRGGIRKGIA